MKILVLEDSMAVQKILQKGLEEAGHTVLLSADLKAARSLIDGHSKVELLIVDRILPDGDGLELVRELRIANNQTPVICLTSRSQVNERVEGLRSGVDDYLIKPFSFEELLARVNAVMRRVSSSTILSAGPLCLNLERHLVELDGQTIELTAREFSMLAVLARNMSKVLSRSKLLKKVWGISYDPQTNVVDVYVRYLRAKLGPGLIHTVRGVGYTLDPDRE